MGLLSQFVQSEKYDVFNQRNESRVVEPYFQNIATPKVSEQPATSTGRFDISKFIPLLFILLILKKL